MTDSRAQSKPAARRRGMSAVEVAVAIIILGLLAALAIPQLTRAGQGDVSAELRARLAVLRTAIELYYRDHRAFPGATGREQFNQQLTHYTSVDGRVSATRDAEHPFGPYLTNGVPTSPLRGVNSGERPVATGVSATFEARVEIVRGDEAPRYSQGSDADWVFNVDTGYLAVNSDALDTSGLRFDRY